MKQLAKQLLKKFGYTVTTKKHFDTLIDTNNLLQLEVNRLIDSNIIGQSDCYNIIKHIFNKEDNITCFDIGANVGQTSEKLKRYFPNATIYAFEPIKNTFQQLLENVKNYKDVMPFNIALGSEVKSVKVSYQLHSQWNSLVPAINVIDNIADDKLEVVDVTTLDKFVAENAIEHIHFLKSDTEGFELEVLKGAHNLLAEEKVDVLYIEVGFSEGDLQHVKWSVLVKELEIYNYKFCGLFEVAHISGLQVYANALFIRKEIIKTLINKPGTF